MDFRDLGRLDLNLLVALEALLEERSVSRAAERLYITQSAMSKTLGRLRDVFNDPLFTRSADGMIPTPRAERLAQHLPQLLQAVQCMVQPEIFNPQNTHADFAVVFPVHICYWALPPLMQKLWEQAPHFSLRTERQEDNQLEQLSTGKIDFLIQVAQEHYPEEYDVTTIGVAPPVLFARAGHPLTKLDKLTWELVEQYPQIRNRIADLSDKHFFRTADSSFIEHEKQIKPHLETDHFFSALEVLRCTDYVMPNLPVFVEEEDLSKDIVALPLPDDEELLLQFVLVSHERTRHSMAHRFMYDKLIEVVEEYRLKNGIPTLPEMRKLRGFAF